jgi:hypothetical protein
MTDISKLTLLMLSFSAFCTTQNAEKPKGKKVKGFPLSIAQLQYPWKKASDGTWEFDGPSDTYYNQTNPHLLGNSKEIASVTVAYSKR